MSIIYKHAEGFNDCALTFPENNSHFTKVGPTEYFAEEEDRKYEDGLYDSFEGDNAKPTIAVCKNMINNGVSEIKDLEGKPAIFNWDE